MVSLTCSVIGSNTLAYILELLVACLLSLDAHMCILLTFERIMAICDMIFYYLAVKSSRYHIILQKRLDRSVKTDAIQYDLLW